MTSKLHGLNFFIKKKIKKMKKNKIYIAKISFHILKKVDFISFYLISIDFLVPFFLLRFSIAPSKT